MNNDQNDSPSKSTWMTIELTPEMNNLITVAKDDSNRSKRAEAELRLADHLKRYSHISAVGMVAERDPVEESVE